LAISFVWFFCDRLIDDLIDLQMRGLSKEEFVLVLRRQINGISRRSATYRSALALHKGGQGEPSMGPFIGKT